MNVTDKAKKAWSHADEVGWGHGGNKDWGGERAPPTGKLHTLNIHHQLS
jgi:hypothetical protein